AFNEERLIARTLQDIPQLIDRVYVIDDASSDGTAAVVQAKISSDPRVELIRHPQNEGPGGAIISGYLKSSQDGYDITVVIGGDAQMPLNEVQSILDPVVHQEADYAKGNRFLYWEKTRKKMPKLRIFGNILITAFTKIASGYYKISDVVDGYTALSKEGIDRVDWSKAWKKYGYPMDFLIRVNAYGLKVKDVPRTPIYLPGERQSQIKGLPYAFKVSPMIFRGFIWRLFFKYGYLDFHPLLLFYLAGMMLLPAGVVYGGYLVYKEIVQIGMTAPQATFCAMLIITGLQFLLFGMWFDMEASK
ncbi:MAG: glycosyltransferase family 2 protein, partial [Candidatus Omnitrophica bacterium]|nr:glycosyltransferase family 2 protein [Candidatus Omnitrophota bacterium]